MTQCGSQAFLFTMAITFVSVRRVQPVKCPASWIPLETEKTYTYRYGYCAYNQLQNKNHRCQCKQMHGNYCRITTALCHFTAVYHGLL